MPPGTRKETSPLTVTGAAFPFSVRMPVMRIVGLPPLCSSLPTVKSMANILS